MDGGAVVTTGTGRKVRRARRREERLAALAAAEADAGGGEGWLALMVERGSADAAMVRAALTIRRAVAEVLPSALGLRAVDPARLVVDGGPMRLNVHPLEMAGGITAELATRAHRAWDAYVRDVCGRPGNEGLLRGRAGSLWRFEALRKVVVDGVRPRVLDAALGLRNGAASDVVLMELKLFAERYRERA